MSKLIGVMSDTHDNMPYIKKAVERFNKENVDLVIHAGDIISPFCAKELEKLKCKFVAIFGNNDGEHKIWKERIRNFGEIHESPYQTELEGLKTLVIHDHVDDIDLLAESQNFDIIIYGHTHKTDNKDVGKTLVLNPGEAGGWLYGKKTVALLWVPEKKAEVLEL
ncbi:metallophosphoesterase [Elusimicrobiota bacterium]